MRRSAFAVFAIVAIAVGLSGASRAGNVSVPACTTGATGSLVPVLQDFSVNQGLESYTSVLGSFTGRLVRGKDTLVRPYFTLPSTCSGSITLTGATLTATISGAAYTLAPYGGTGSGSVPASISPSSSVDPLFAVPAADLKPGNGSTTFTATWSVSVTFTQNKSSAPITETYNSAPIPTTTFEVKTNALRLLVIPMGDASQTFSSQFPAQAQTDVQNAMSTLSRIYPVEAGVGDLSSTSGGIRYTLDLAAMVDLRSISGAYDSNGRFCGSQVNFDAIKAQLSQFLQSWNTQNPGATADRVVGAVYGGNNGATTYGISDGGSFGCAEGMAGVNSQVAWVRAIDDNTSAHTPTYSWTGGVLAMEVAHTFGLVPSPRASLTSAYHSANIAADVIAPTGRAYNVTSRSYVSNNHSVMRYDTSTSPFDNTDTLFEPQDYNDMLCFLTPGAATNPECLTTGTAGTSTGVAAGPMFVGSGTTDGTQAGTSFVESYYSTNVAPSGTCSGSAYHLLQLSAGVVQRDDPICVETLTSDHDLGGGAAQINDTSGMFSFAVPGVGADTVEFTHSGTVLYRRDRQASPPVVTSVSSVQDFGSLSLTAPVIPPKPDILILPDTTGSMGDALKSVKDALTATGGIIPTILASRPTAAFGAANYRDVACDPTTGYVLNQPITTASADVQTAVGNWQASGGCDAPEDQLNALYQIATHPDSVGWRAGSTRIIVWFGDSNGHDPSPLPIEGVTQHSLVDAVKALVGAKIEVIAVPVNTGSGNGLETPVHDDALNADVDQPAYIVAATGGRLQPLTNATDVANAITAGLQNLPVTLAATTSCDTDHIALTLGSRNPPRTRSRAAQR